jgi:tRNA pseudouridine38-40 synthase
MDGDSRLTSLRLTVEYDGSEFSGFQWQPAVRTVAGVLEEALKRLFGEPVKVTPAGRTDAGVHATGQVVSLATTARFTFERLAHALNWLLPPDCSVRTASVVEPGFSARYSARQRTYVYAILNRPQRSALLAPYAWHVTQPLDLGAMRAAAEHAVGEHDFRSFCSLGPGGDGVEAGSTVRTVHRFAVEPHGDLVRLEIAADGFLHRMVRALSGTLVECGRGRRSSQELRNVLEAAERSMVAGVAPPHGLYLAGVRYADGYDSFLEPPVLAV